jgi:hypothetical protein
MSTDLEIRVRRARQGKLGHACDRCASRARVYPVPGVRKYDDSGVTRQARWCEACIAATSTASDPFYVIDQATEATK